MQLIRKQPSKKRFNTGVRPLADILPVVGERLNLPRKVQEFSVLSLWPQVVEPVFQGRTQAMRIRRVDTKNHLLVRVDHSVVAAELTFHLQTVQNRLNAYAKETGIVIHHIEIRVR